MPPLPPQRPRLMHKRGAWLAAGLTLLAVVITGFVRHGAPESALGMSALTPRDRVDFTDPESAARAAELDPAVVTPTVTIATGGLEPDRARKAVAAAKAPREATIVVGFEVTDAIDGRPIDARPASVDFELTRGDERWAGRRLRHGHRLITVLQAFGVDFHAALWGADGLQCVELDPATPLGVRLAFQLQLTFAAETEGGLELLPRATYRAEGALTLTGASHQLLPPVVCRRIDAWAEGSVVAGPHIALHDARIELIEQPAFVSHTFGGDLLVETSESTEPAAASAPVQPDHTFSVPGPPRATQPRVRLRLVLADGRTFVTKETHNAFRGPLVLSLESSRTATGRLLFRGESAAGLARLHAERDGARIGHVILEQDGSFTLSGAPFDTFDVVVESGRPGGELARFPLASLTGDIGSSKLDLGVIEVAGHAQVMELELVDRHGAAAAAQLRWRARGIAGGVSLRAADVHTLLLPPAVAYELELVSPQHAEPFALAAEPGRVRVVLDR